MSFYAYLHCKPDGTPFYVGKGTRSRAKSIKRANKWHTNIVNKYGEDAILVGKMECSSDEISIDLEKGLIKRLRAMGVTLVNQTDGGEGCLGYKHTEEFKRKIAESLIGRPRSDQTKEKLRKANLGKKHSDESRAKMSLVQKGKRMPESAKLKISLANKGKVRSQEARDKVSRANKGKKTFLGKRHTEETRLKISRNQGGTAIEARKDAVTILFSTIAEASKSLGLKSSSISRHLSQTKGSNSPGIKGWRFRRVLD